MVVLQASGQRSGGDRVADRLMRSMQPPRWLDNDRNTSSLHATFTALVRRSGGASQLVVGSGDGVRGASGHPRRPFQVGGAEGRAARLSSIRPSANIRRWGTRSCRLMTCRARRGFRERMRRRCGPQYGQSSSRLIELLGLVDAVRGPRPGLERGPRQGAPSRGGSPSRPRPRRRPPGAMNFTAPWRFRVA